VTTALARSIRLPHAVALVIGIIVGASIFVQPSEISRLTPGFTAMLLAWAAAGALTLAGALICAELATAYPRTGGVYVFLRELYSPAVGFLWGWAMFWSMHSGIIAAIAMVFARYATPLVGLDERAARPVALAGVVMLSAVNYAGVRAGSRVQAWLTWIKVGAVVVLAAVLFAWVGTHGAVSKTLPPSLSAEALRAKAEGGRDIANFLLAIAAGLFAFGGWHMVTYSTGETVDARRTIPRALVAGTLAVTAIYMALNAAYVLVLPMDRVLASPRIAADAVAVVGGQGAAAAIGALVALSSFGAMNGIILAGPRVYLAMAEDGVAFTSLGAVHPRFRTPHVAIAAQGVWTCVLVLTGTYRGLFTRVVYTEWIFFGLLAAGLIRARARQPYAPAFRVRPVPLLPAVFAGACLLIVVNQIAAQPLDSAIGLLIVAAGIPVYLVWRARRARA
jgi:APA family basic amino acid/polyamine antiporter